MPVASPKIIISHAATGRTLTLKLARLDTTEGTLDKNRYMGSDQKFTDAIALVGDAADFLSNLYLKGWAGAGTLSVEVVVNSPTLFTVNVYEENPEYPEYPDPVLIATGTGLYAGTTHTVTLTAQNGSGVSGSVRWAGVTAALLPLTADATAPIASQIMAEDPFMPGTYVFITTAEEWRDGTYIYNIYDGSTVISQGRLYVRGDLIMEGTTYVPV